MKIGGAMMNWMRRELVKTSSYSAMNVLKNFPYDFISLEAKKKNI